MPVQHVVMIRFKDGTTKEQVDKLYNGLMSLEERPSVTGVTAGENFDKASQWSFVYVVTISNLRAFKDDNAHKIIVDAFLKPIVQEASSTDFEFPRAIAEHGAFLTVGKEDVAIPKSPSMMRWSTSHSHPDIGIVHGTVARPKGQYNGERFVVGSHPINRKFYFDVTIERNNRPKQRGVCVGIVSQGDLEKVKNTGEHFKTLSGAFGVECNSGFVGAGYKGTKEIRIPVGEWDHGTKIGVFVDQEKGIIQFFQNRKKVGPALHEDLKDRQYFPAVCLGKDHEVSIQFNASCPAVWIQ